jgi:hypothetical protein
VFPPIRQRYQLSGWHPEERVPEENSREEKQFEELNEYEKKVTSTENAINVSMRESFLCLLTCSMSEISF